MTVGLSPLLLESLMHTSLTPKLLRQNPQIANFNKLEVTISEHFWIQRYCVVFFYSREIVIVMVITMFFSKFNISTLKTAIPLPGLERPISGLSFAYSLYFYMFANGHWFSKGFFIYFLLKIDVFQNSKSWLPKFGQ